MRQKGVLLAFVEAVHLVHKDQRAPPTLSLGHLRFFHSLTNVFDPAQHSADGDELRVKRIRHQAGDGGLAGARRPPQDATVRLPRLKRQFERHALAQQMRLANDFGQGLGAQALGQRRA